MKRTPLIIALAMLAMTMTDGQEKTAWKYKQAIVNVLYSDMDGSLTRIESARTQAELDKVEAAILDVPTTEKSNVLERVRVMLQSVKAADAISAVDQELAKLKSTLKAEGDTPGEK